MDGERTQNRDKFNPFSQKVGKTSSFGGLYDLRGFLRGDFKREIAKSRFYLINFLSQVERLLSGTKAAFT